MRASQRVVIAFWATLSVGCPTGATPIPLRPTAPRAATPPTLPPATRVEECPHPALAVSGDVQVPLDDVQRSLASCRELLVRGGRAEADRPQSLRHQI